MSAPLPMAATAAAGALVTVLLLLTAAGGPTAHRLADASTTPRLLRDGRTGRMAQLHANAGPSGRDVTAAPQDSRRQALASGAAALAALQVPAAAWASYGQSANVFGRPAPGNQVFTVSGDGWTGIMPAKYNPSKEREYPGTVARWEDSFDTITCASVLVLPGGGLGSLDEVRRQYVEPLLGRQSFDGDTLSEGGFERGKVASSALLDQGVTTKDGKEYYQYEILTRTADGDEGGKHQLFRIAASDGKVYILKHQAGDKRWFKGLERPIRDSLDAFLVR